MIIAAFAAMDLYSYQNVRKVFPNKWVRRVYWFISISGYLFMIWSVRNLGHDSNTKSVVNAFMIWVVLWYAPKLLIIAILLIEDIIRLTHGFSRKIIRRRRKKTPAQPTIPGRRVFVQQVALGLAAVPFLGIVHGVWKGKYNYQVIRKQLFFDDLPEAFDGLVVAQISDIHTGSFDNREKVQYGVELLKAQKADLILFTGDMVNNKSEELVPWLDVFSGIEAPYGTFATLGNHDYGDYARWESDGDKERDVAELIRMEEEVLGFRNLRNENVRLEKNGEYIDLIGVENWGRPPFPQYGNLQAATTDLEKGSFKILMSHDPTHFDAEVKTFDKKIQLTLSGHTHGMQFGIEIPGWLKWSPSSLQYPKWAGLYREMGRYLYVNRGFGYLAFPGRVGIWPEITVLELKRKA